MAKFEVVHEEGLYCVRVKLENETIRAEAGALRYMLGNIVMDAKLPSLPAYIKTSLAGEAVFRPSYTGTGIVVLEPSLGGFHVFETGDEPWIIESGAYLASDGSVKLGFTREKFSTSFWSGEGLIDLQTKVSGTGKVVISSEGPVEELTLNNETMRVDGKFVLARTPGISYTIARATRTYLGRFFSGESHLRTYRGTGKLLFAPMPYWRHRMYKDRVSTGPSKHR